METDTYWENVYGWELQSGVVYSGNLAYGAKATEATLRLAGGVNLTNTITPTLTFWQQANWSVPAQGQLLCQERPFYFVLDSLF